MGSPPQRVSAVVCLLLLRDPLQLLDLLGISSDALQMLKDLCTGACSSVAQIPLCRGPLYTTSFGASCTAASSSSQKDICLSLPNSLSFTPLLLSCSSLVLGAILNTLRTKPQGERPPLIPPLPLPPFPPFPPFPSFSLCFGLGRRLRGRRRGAVFGEALSVLGQGLADPDLAGRRFFARQDKQSQRERERESTLGKKSRVKRGTSNLGEASFMALSTSQPETWGGRSCGSCGSLDC